MGIHMLNYLDDWLILAQSEDEPLRVPRTQGKFCQERTVPQPMNFVPGNSYLLSPNEGGSHARTFTSHSAACGFIQTLSPSPSQIVSKDAWPHGLSVFVTSVGPASHAAPLVLAKTLSSSTCLAALAPLVKPSVDGTGCAPGLQKRGDLDRRLQLRLGGAVRRQTGFWPLVEKGRSPSHQLPGNAGSMFGPSHFSVVPEGASRLRPLGQYDGGVLYKLPQRSFLEAPLYSSRVPLEVGSAQLALAQSAGQTKPGSRHAISEQCPLRRNMGNLQQARGRPLRLRILHSLPNLFFKGKGRVAPRLAQPPPLCLSPDRPDPAGNQANQGTEAQSSVSSPALEESPLVRGAVSSAHCSSVAHSPETKPPLSSFMRHIVDIVLPARAVGKGSLPFHAQGLCSSYSSLTRCYGWPIIGQEQPGCSFLEGV